MVDVQDQVANSKSTGRRALDRLAELMTLRAGWLDGDGKPISEAAHHSATVFVRSRPEIAARAGIFPTPDGGISFEFEISGWDLSVECSERGEVELHGVEIDGTAVLEPRRYPNLTDGLLESIDTVGHE